MVVGTVSGIPIDSEPTAGAGNKNKGFLSLVEVRSLAQLIGFGDVRVCTTLASYVHSTGPRNPYNLLVRMPCHTILGDADARLTT